ncbi:unnamed protein product [Phytophthora lilii]|uniref:Unnamed protein product n=1 Tax=Phytophthora lilii TaxID=2077276 RepID=A0A9W6UEM1_9STRA|nr:unnamed protein product [Phytophthora lilii]
MGVCCLLALVGYKTVCVNVDVDSGEKPKPAAALPELPQSAQKDKSGKANKKAKLYAATLSAGLHLKDAQATDKTRQRKRITLKLEEVADAQKLVRDWLVELMMLRLSSHCDGHSTVGVRCCEGIRRPGSGSGDAEGLPVPVRTGGD